MNRLSLSKYKDIALTVARLLIGVLFTLSGYSKLVQPFGYFEFIVNQYSIIPENLVQIVCFITPWIEFIFGVHVLLGIFTGFYTWGLVALTAGFQFVLGQAVLRKLPMDECGCFGGGFIHLSLYQSFLIDTVMVLLLIQIATRAVEPFSLDAWFAAKNKPN